MSNDGFIKIKQLESDEIKKLTEEFIESGGSIEEIENTKTNDKNPIKYGTQTKDAIFLQRKNKKRG